MEKKKIAPTLKRKVTLADIALECGISKMSVSLALRKRHGVSEATRALVERKAKELGYRPDPELAALHRYRHNAATPHIQASLAWLDTSLRPAERPQRKEFELYWQGAKENAHQLGYRLERFNLADTPIQRIHTILTTRNIRGIILPPLHSEQASGLEAFDWSDFAVIRLGQTIPSPKTHYVASAQMKNTVMAFQQARQRGYQRIGYVGSRNDSRFFSAGYLWAQNAVPQTQRLPMLEIDPPIESRSKREALKSWLREHRPDAIITDKGALLPQLQNLGYRIPEDIGLATTSVHDTPIDAGIDQRPYEIGRTAIRLIASLIAEGSYGIPEYGDEMLVEGRWVDGSMLPSRP